MSALLAGRSTTAAGLEQVPDDPTARLHVASVSASASAFFARCGPVWVFGGMIPANFARIGTSMRFAVNFTSRCADFITYAELRDGFTRLLGATSWTAEMLAERRYPAECRIDAFGRPGLSPELMDGRNPDLCLALDLLEGPPPETSTGGNVQTRQGELVNLLRDAPDRFVLLDEAWAESQSRLFTQEDLGGHRRTTEARSLTTSARIQTADVHARNETQWTRSSFRDSKLNMPEAVRSPSTECWHCVNGVVSTKCRRQLCAVSSKGLGLLPKVRATAVEGWTPPADDDDSPFIPDLLGQYLREVGAHQLLMPEDEILLGRRMRAARELLTRKGQRNDASLRDFLAGYVESPSLEPHERRIVSEGAAAEERMFVCNLRLVVSIARKTHWHHARLDPLDIVQAGNLGLSRAIQKFDERKGFRFSTYATWWIRQAITRHVADTGRIIRLPVHVHDQIKRMTAAQRALEIDLTRSPTLQELASFLGMDPGEVQALQDWSLTTASLDAPLGLSSSATIGSMVPDEASEDLQNQNIDRWLMKSMIDEALAGLSERDAYVIRLRFGLIDDRQHTLEEIGKIMGLTRERIRQIEKKTLVKLLGFAWSRRTQRIFCDFSRDDRSRGSKTHRRLVTTECGRGCSRQLTGSPGYRP